MWTYGVAAADDFLSPEERQWLSSQARITLVYDGKYPPINFTEPAGRFGGFAADLVKLVEQKIGRTFLIEEMHSWTGLLGRLRSGSADFCAAMGATPERSAYLDFTTPYATMPVVIITAKNVTDIHSVSDLLGRRVAVVTGSITQKYVEGLAPGQLEVVPEPSVQAGLRDAAFGVVDALVENLSVASYYLDQEQLRNLQVAGNTGLVIEICMGVRKDLPHLLSILNKTLARISPDEWAKLREKWLRLEYDDSGERRRQLAFVLILLAVAVVGFLAYFFWSASLRRQVATRTEALKTELAARAEIEERLRLSEQRFRQAIDCAPIPICIISKSSQFTLLNAQFTAAYGYALEDIPTVEAWGNAAFPDPATREEAATRWRSMFDSPARGEKPAESSIFEIRCKDGATKWAEIAVQFIDDNSLVVLDDVSRRVQAEKAMREASERFRNIVQASPFGLFMFRLDADGQLILVDANPAAAAILGLETGGFAGKRLEEVMPRLDGTAIPEIFRWICVVGGNWSTEALEYQGEKVRGFFSVTAFQTTPGELAVFFQDVSAMMAARKALEQSESRLKLAMEATKAAIFDMNTQTGHVYFSQRWYDMLGYGRDDVPDTVQAWLALCHQDDQQEFLHLRESLVPDAVHDREFRIRTKYGGWCWVVGHAKSVESDAEGGVRRMIGTCLDVTEPKVQDLRYRTLFESARDAVLIIEDGLIVDCNLRAIAMLGCGRDEIVGHQPHERLVATQPDGRQAPGVVAEALAQAMRGAAPLGQWEFQDCDGHPVPTEVACSGLEMFGKNQVLAIVRDIGERKRMQEMMVQSEKMMSIGGLAAGMAHEINNPLGIIVQGAQNALRRLSPQLEKNKLAAEECGIEMRSLVAYLEKRKVGHYLEGINEAGCRAARIVQAMLKFARRSDSAKGFHKLTELLNRALELVATDFDLKKRYDFHEIEIVRAFEPHLPSVLANETELEQVFLNLLKNAAQAMAEKTYEPDGHPTITLRAYRQEGHVCVDVGDNGPGMDEQTRKRIFEPFFTTKALGVGTGLGLSVSYFIITHNHGGQIEVQSLPGKGATFTVCLPT